MISSEIDNPQGVNGYVMSFIPDDDRAERVYRLISQLDEILRQTESSLENLFKGMEKAVASTEDAENPPLTSEQLDDVKERLSIVIQAYPGLQRQAKAQRLSEATGHRLESVEIICDLRPIFDERRDSIEGVIPYTILKVVCTGPDGLPIMMEAILSQADVEGLAKKSEAALKKLDRLRSVLGEKDLPIPPVTMVKKGN